MTRHLFVLGGARSGKSRYAQQRAEATGLSCVFIATAQPFDAEMRDRIERHRRDRGDGWTTVEVPVNLAAAVADHAAQGCVLLVDCLTLWTSNLMLGDHDVDSAVADLLRALAHAAGPVILVANEVGLGVVPDNALARRFRDAAGLVNQAVAAACAEAQWLAAGLPLMLKG